MPELVAERSAAAGRMDEARRELRAALEARLAPEPGRLALLVNPRLGPDERQALLVVIEGR